MISYSSENGPKSSNPRYFIEKHKVHLTIICLQVISVISVQDNSIDSPLACLSSALDLQLSLSKDIVKRVV